MSNLEKVNKLVGFDFGSQQNLLSSVGIEKKTSFGKRVGAVVKTYLNHPRSSTYSLIGAISAGVGSEVGYQIALVQHPHAKAPTLFAITLGSVAASIIAESALALPDANNEKNEKKIKKAEPGSAVTIQRLPTLREAWRTGRVSSPETIIYIKPMEEPQPQNYLPFQ